MIDALTHRAFGDGAPIPPEDEAWRAASMAELVRGDPGGAWGAERDGALAGVALAIVREGLWGLSLLVVSPEAQGAGAGRALLERALAHGAGSTVGMIHSSDDHRALRLYARAGFRLLPCLEANGRVRRAGLPAVTGVRRGGLDDLELARAVDREQRGAARGDELAHAVSSGRFHMLVAPGRGYAVVRPGALVCLAARDAGTARSLLATALAEASPDEPFAVSRLTGDQPWAMDLVLDAGLELGSGGALAVRGRPGPLAPYLPSGLWL